MINDIRLDFLALTETWLQKHETAKIKEMTPFTHVFFSCPRIKGKGGGVGIFMTKNFKKVKINSIENITSFEGMYINCEYESRKLLFIIIYRPPHTNKTIFNNEISIFLESLDMVGVNIILCGDFNLWYECSTDNHVSDFREILLSFQLMNLIDKETSSTGHILDLLCTDINNDIIKNIDNAAPIKIQL